jgi:hypothetical protein
LECIVTRDDLYRAYHRAACAQDAIGDKADREVARHKKAMDKLQIDMAEAVKVTAAAHQAYLEASLGASLEPLKGKR